MEPSKVVPIGLKTRLDERMKLALEAMPVAVAWIRLSDGHSEFLNERYVELFGYSRDDFDDVLEHMRTVFADKAQAEFAVAATRDLIGQNLLTQISIPTQEVSVLRKDGTNVMTSFSGVVIPDADMILVTFVDITAAKQREELLRSLATQDPLTGLANRRAFDAAILDTLSRSGRTGGFGILILDLDGFKELNDTCGRAAGDELIIRFARILESLVRADDLVARWGGDEFAVLMQPPVSGDMIAGIVDRLNGALSEPWMVDGIARTVSVSGGWATRPDDALTATDLLRVADAAMYRAKNSRKAGKAAGGRRTTDQPHDPS